MEPSQRQEAVTALQQRGLSQRVACKIMRDRRLPRETTGFRVIQDAPLIKRLTRPAQDHPRYGCKRLYVISERIAGEGDPYVNYKRFRRLYRLANLQIARRRRRSRAQYVLGMPLRRAGRPHDIWTMDYVSDRLLHGRVFRALTLLDERSRYPLAVDPAFSYPSASVVRTLEDAVREHGYPKCLRIDNGHEFIASALWKRGPMSTASNCSLSSPESRRRTRLSNHLRAGLATNASTKTSSCLLTKFARSSRIGSMTTTWRGLIHRLEAKPGEFVQGLINNQLPPLAAA